MPHMAWGGRARSIICRGCGVPQVLVLRELRARLLWGVRKAGHCPRVRKAGKKLLEGREGGDHGAEDGVGGAVRPSLQRQSWGVRNSLGVQLGAPEPNNLFLRQMRLAFAS